MADSVETGAYVALQNPWRGVLMRQHREALPNRIRCGSLGAEAIGVRIALSFRKGIEG
jgi:hypothetical protein